MSVPIPGNSIRRDSDLIRLIRKSTVSSQAAAGDHSFFSDFFFLLPPVIEDENLKADTVINVKRKRKWQQCHRRLDVSCSGAKLLKRGENKTELLLWEAEC